MEQTEQQLSKLMEGIEANAKKIESLKEMSDENAQRLDELNNVCNVLFLFIDENGLRSDFEDFINSLPMPVKN